MANGVPRVLCVDDNQDIGELFVRAFRDRADLECAGHLLDSDRLSEEVARRRADVVVLDLTLPGADPLETIRQLRQAQPACRVLVYSGHEDPSTIRSAMQAGAAGFLCKSETITEVLDMARRITTEAQ